MRTKAILFFFMVFTCSTFYSLQAEHLNIYKIQNEISSKRIINSADSIIFDLPSATLTTTYIDIPLHLYSDDLIFSFDYALTFNLSKLSYSATLNALQNNNSLSYSAFFNPNDLYLRSTCSSQQILPSSVNLPILIIRFALSAPCVSITAADFSNVLTILNGTQCSNSVRTLNFNQFIPTANFYTGPTCLNSLIHFSDSSKISNGSINAWLWNFGNGNTSLLQNNITTYSTSGTSATTLVVLANNGCSDTIVKQLTISIPPISSFSYTYDCIKDTVFFSNTSTITIGSITGSQWYFGDLSPLSTLQNPNHHFLSSGFYRIKLTSTSNNSCISTKQEIIPIRPADFNKDGITDVNDFMILVPALGTTCN